MDELTRTIKMVECRLRWVGNLYGDKWQSEKRLFTVCLEALRFYEENRDRELTGEEKSLVMRALLTEFHLDAEDINEKGTMENSIARKVGI